jgi:3-dehydroquinate dehydratase-1
LRLQSKKALKIRGKILGGPRPWICLPLVAGDRTDLLEQARAMAAFTPDAMEWRVDRFEAVLDADAVLSALGALREAVGDVPLIFTCRAVHEGGFQEIAAADRLRLNKAVIASGHIDLIDTEMSNEETMVTAMKAACRNTGCPLILSYHNFDETPDEAFILDRLTTAGELGADVAKVAVMPKNLKDVLTLLSATYTARTERLDIPIITMSMGAEGGITRIAGGLFGSDLTFALGKASSAPGQIPIEDLRKAWLALPFD